MVTKIKRRGFNLRLLCMRLGVLFILILLPLQAPSVQAAKPVPASQAAPEAPAVPTQPPVAVDDSFSAFASQPLITANVLSNDSDPLHSSLFIKSFDTQGTRGLVSLVNPWQNSSLDVSFGTRGKVSTTIMDTSAIKMIAIQPDHKIVAAGDNYPDNTTFIVARYNPDGSLDTSFNGSGTTNLQFSSRQHYLWSLLLQPDGKIVVAGSVLPDMAIARFNPDGSLDTSFSGDGKLLINFGSTFDTGLSLARQGDGKLLVAGSVDDNFGLARINTNGSLDASFSGDGKVTIDFGGEDNVQTVLAQTNGKIVVVGQSLTPNGYDFNYHPAVACYNANGSLDSSFGNGGKVTTPQDLKFFVAQAVLQPDGKILVTGTSQDSSGRIVLIRYNTDGSLETSFGVGGMALTDLGQVLHITSIAMQPDGKILVAGSVYYEPPPYHILIGSDFLLLRFAGDGSLDTSFGSGGEVIIDFAGDKDYGYALAYQQDGKIIVAGMESYTSDLDKGNYGLARVNQDGLYQLRNSFRYDPNGQFDVLPPGETASDTFSYVVSNGVLTDTATVTIMVSGANETFLPILER